ncbi:DNA ligase [Caballeronia glathei]|uniref:DNA ligase n=2 Tax=Caballeronia glathei TaxID=60547 RepID=A0A069PAY7_9BURK|nr:DNA ligase [Caballeronia glathei]
MLPTLAPSPFSHEDWLFELKYDGFRCLVRKVGSHIELISRRGNSFNRSFSDIIEAVMGVPGDFVWDAELTVDEPTGQSSLERLQWRALATWPMHVRAAAKQDPARLYVFDVLAAGGRDLRRLPLLERKKVLRDSFDNTGVLVNVAGVVAAGASVFEQAKADGFEGVIAKRLDSTYQRGRSNDWQDIKHAEYSRPTARSDGAAKPRRRSDNRRGSA